MDEGSLESVEVLGVSIIGGPPLGTIHFELSSGLHILYGKNGAGKTRTLEAIKGGFANRWSGPSTVWVHLRVLDEPTGRTVATDWFRDALFFELSDALRRGIDDDRPSASDVLSAVGDELVRGYSVELPELSIQGLVIANAWVNALDGIPATAGEIRQNCYLSVEVSGGVSRVYLSVVEETMPVSRELLKAGIQFAGKRDGDRWDRRTARSAQPLDVSTLPAINEFASAVQRLAEKLGTEVQATFRSIMRMDPVLSFHHDDRPPWVPCPVVPLTVLGGIPICDFWGDGLSVGHDLLAVATLDALGLDQFEIMDDDGFGVRARADTPARLAHLASRASDLYGSFLLDAPPLDLRLLPPEKWLQGSIVEWLALDADSLEWVSLGDLSEAQRRWAVLGVRLALDELGHGSGKGLVTEPAFLDEPEQALHSTATRHLSVGLADLAYEWMTPIVVTSHSVGMIGHPASHLVHVHRDTYGEVLLSRMHPDAKLKLADGAAQLGLSSTDLLQLTRLFLFAEGAHDVAVFERLFGDDFAEAGIALLPLGGTRRLAAILDSRFLLSYSDAHLLLVLDNSESSRLLVAWEKAKVFAKDSNETRAHAVLAEVERSRLSDEEARLCSFAHAAIDLGQIERLHFYGLSQPDMIYYLPVEAFVEGATWEELTTQYLNGRQTISGKKEDFKSWLRRELGARITVTSFERAAASIKIPGPELKAVASLAVELAERGLRRPV